MFDFQLTTALRHDKIILSNEREDKLMNSVCFTGHRIIPGTAEIGEKLSGVLEKWICIRGITDFYAGGAVGWDTLAANTVIGLRKKYPRIKLHLVLPCSNEEQTAKWTEPQRREFYRILRLADSVEYISDRYYKGCMKERNIRLVEHADTCCFCYWDPGAFSSGTGQTVRLAKKKQLTIVNFRE